jgi:hypothetical protein
MARFIGETYSLLQETSYANVMDCALRLPRTNQTPVFERDSWTAMDRKQQKGWRKRFEMNYFAIFS